MNKLFTILIMFSLSLPVFAIDGQEVEMEPTDSSNLEVINTEELDSINSTNPEQDLLSVPNALPTKYKEPVSKKKLAKKFIIAMLCVAGTSILLYSTLSIYNRVRDGFTQEVTPPEGEAPLDTPSDLAEAVKTFIDKTHWEGM